ncbi:hypothetical protein KEHDKFFH_17020 [Marinobacter maroccanus]|uniref:KfrA N-terminal DNA-binding domain-containing protein n=1 Tax=Marinobacter maroccanus TaxID=2055143 RepID=A0A2S5Z6P3_9GAMM|nr:hypothetical protein KEHDKFFH_17020 [Marinobacter maroccanus]
MVNQSVGVLTNHGFSEVYFLTYLLSYFLIFWSILKKPAIEEVNAMRPADFSDEKIIEAGKRLQVQKGKVTGYGLRIELGGGDQNRLISVWRKFAEQETKEAVQDTELPPEIEELLDSAGQTLLSQLRSVTASIHQAATKNADRRVAEITRQLKELEEQTDAELKDAGIVIEKLESESGELQQELTKTEEKLASALEEAKKYEMKAFQLETQLNEMKGVEELIKRLEALEQRATTETVTPPQEAGH